MFKRFVIAALSVLVPLIACVAQDTLAVISSVPLPEVLEGKLNFASSPPGCGEDGNLSIYADDGDNDVRPAIFRLSPNGNVLAHIEIQKLQGFTNHTDFLFASGPNGETYVLLQNGYPYYDENQHKDVVEGTAGSTTQLLRFNATGDLISRISLPPQLYASGLASFSDGTVLVIESAPGQPYSRRPFVAKLFTAKGEQVRDVVLPAELSSPPRDGRHEMPIIVTMTARDGEEVWIVRVGYAPALVAISVKGDIRLRTKLKTPDGFRVINPRVAGDRLFTMLFPNEHKVEGEAVYAEFDTATGDVVQRLLGPGSRGVWHAICNSHNGMYFINSQERTLNVVAPAPQK